MMDDQEAVKATIERVRRALGHHAGDSEEIKKIAAILIENSGNPNKSRECLDKLLTDDEG